MSRILLVLGGQQRTDRNYGTDIVDTDERRSAADGLLMVAFMRRAFCSLNLVLNSTME